MKCRQKLGLRVYMGLYMKLKACYSIGPPARDPVMYIVLGGYLET